MINAWAPAKASLNSDGESKRSPPRARRRATLEDGVGNLFGYQYTSTRSLSFFFESSQTMEFEGASARVDKIGESHQSSAEVGVA